MIILLKNLNIDINNYKQHENEYKNEINNNILQIKIENDNYIREQELHIITQRKRREIEIENTKLNNEINNIKITQNSIEHEYNNLKCEYDIYKNIRVKNMRYISCVCIIFVFQ